MSDFFGGWRRKAGVGSLMMACVVMATWIRSQIVLDVVSFTVGDEQHQIATIGGVVFWGSWTLNEIPRRIPQNGWRTIGFEGYEPTERLTQMQYLVYFVYGSFRPERDTEIIRSIKTLATINKKPVAEFWKEVEQQ